MISEFSGKRLLILGSNVESIPLIQRANELGLRTYVADYDSTSPGKVAATVPIDIDGKDVASLATLCRAENIDGIVVGVADRLIEPYADLCYELSLPCYATQKNSRILTNKVLFNKLLQQFNIPVIPSITMHDSTMDYAGFPSLPLLVKPADGNSGKGLTRCNSTEDVQPAIEKALQASASKTVLIERYMDCDDLFVYLSIVDGTLSVCAMADRHTMAMDGDAGRVCIAASYPSKYLHLFTEKYATIFQDVVRFLGIKYGILMISGFVRDRQIFFYDPGFRLQGEAPDVHLADNLGILHTDMLIEFALKGLLSNKENYQPPLPCYTQGGYGVTLWLLCEAGAIHQIIGLEEIQNDPCIIIIRQRFFKGDVVSASTTGTEGQVFARIYMKSETSAALISTINKVRKHVKVLDPTGRNLIVSTNTEKFFEELHEL